MRDEDLVFPVAKRVTPREPQGSQWCWSSMRPGAKEFSSRSAFQKYERIQAQW